MPIARRERISLRSVLRAPPVRDRSRIEGQTAFELCNGVSGIERTYKKKKKSRRHGSLKDRCERNLELDIAQSLVIYTIRIKASSQRPHIIYKILLIVILINNIQIVNN